MEFTDTFRPGMRKKTMHKKQPLFIAASLPGYPDRWHASVAPPPGER